MPYSPAASRASAGVVGWLIAALFGGAGTMIGAVVGLLSGFTTEDGFIPGTLTGAMAGALVSLELGDTLVRIWSLQDCSTVTRMRCTRLVLRNLTTDGLPRGSLFFTIESALHDQRQPIEPSFPIHTRRAAIQSLPATTVTEETTAAGQQTNCPICVDEFQAGERARRLPACCHVFHMACIDGWLLLNFNCPICRHAVC